jgi:hypothetical protein
VAPGDAVLTDDWAPIEQLTDQMMKRSGQSRG